MRTVACFVFALLITCNLAALAKDKAPKKAAPATDDAAASDAATTTDTPAADTKDDSKPDSPASEEKKDDEKKEDSSAADPKKSGPQPGESLEAFDVEKLAGAGNDNVAIGEKLCYRCMLGDRPVIMIFTNDLTPPLADLITTVDKKVKDKSDKKLASFMVLLNGDPDILKVAAEQIVEQLGVKNMAIVKSIDDNVNGPKTYKLNPAMGTTVLVYREGKVQANYAIPPGGIDKKAITSIMASTDKMLKAK
jgi:hypothetical protein